MDRIVITGTHGFIGSHLLKAFKKSKALVFPIERELLYNQFELQEYLERLQPDYIYHCAAYGNMNNHDNDQMIIEANVVCTFRLLTASVRVPYTAFINLSSSSVYGKTTEPMKETDQPHPLTLYGLTKLSAEYLALHFFQGFQKPIVNIRLFSVYGPGEASYRFIPSVIQKLRSGKPIDIIPGVHDWIYISDVVRALRYIAAHIEDFAGQTVNVGTGRQTDNETVVEILARLHRRNWNKVRFNRVSGILRPYDSPRWQADMSILRSTGFKVTHSLEEGLKKTYDAYS